MSLNALDGVASIDGRVYAGVVNAVLHASLPRRQQQRADVVDYVAVLGAEAEHTRLLTHVQNVFHVPQAEHARVVAAERLNKPCYDVKVLVGGARLSSADGLGASSCFCIVTLTDQPYSNDAAGPAGDGERPVPMPRPPLAAVRRKKGRSQEKMMELSDSSQNIAHAVTAAAAENVRYTGCTLSPSMEPQWNEAFTFGLGERYDVHMNFYVVASSASGNGQQQQPPSARQRGSAWSLSSRSSSTQSLVDYWRSHDGADMSDGAMTPQEYVPRHRRRRRRALVPGELARLECLRRRKHRSPPPPPHSGRLVSGFRVPPAAGGGKEPASLMVDTLAVRPHDQRCVAGSLPIESLPADRWSSLDVPLYEHDAWQSAGAASATAGHMVVRGRRVIRARAAQPEADRAAMAVTELANVAIHLLQHSFTAQQLHRSSHWSAVEWDHSDAVLAAVCAANGISEMTRRVVMLSLLLDWDHEMAERVSTGMIRRSVAELRAACVSVTEHRKPSSDAAAASIHNYSQLRPGDDDSYDMAADWSCAPGELDELERAFIAYAGRYIASAECAKPALFPPTASSGAAALINFARKLELLAEMCSLPLWPLCGRAAPTVHLSDVLMEQVTCDTKAWLAARASAPSHAFDHVSQLAAAVEELTGMFEHGAVAHYHRFFASYEASYATTIMRCLDDILSAECRSAVERATDQMLAERASAPRGTTATDSIASAYGKCTLKLCVALVRLRRALSGRRRHHSTVHSETGATEQPADPLGFTVTDEYERWFIRVRCDASLCAGGEYNALVQWASLWHETSEMFVRRLLAADFAQRERAAELLEYAESAVDLLSVCKGLTTDYAQLHLNDMDSRIMLTVKLTDIICDHMFTYARYLTRTMATRPSVDRNAYIRAANSVEHVGAYMQRHLAGFLLFDQLRDDCGGSRGQQIHATLTKLVAHRAHECHSAAVSVLQAHIDQWHCAELQRHCCEMTMTQEQWTSRMRSYMRQLFPHERADSLLAYCERSLACAQGLLSAALSPVFARLLWMRLQRCTLRTLPTGQPSDYYQRIIANLNSLKSLFASFVAQFDAADADGGRGRTFSIAFDESLGRRLHYNSLTSHELILEYFSHRADMTEQREVTEQSCTVRIRLGYMRITSERVSLTVHVISAHNFPILDPLTQSCDPYIRLDLLPWELFPDRAQASATSSVSYQSRNAAFDETFTFDVPQSSFFTSGATLCVFGIDHDVLSHNDLAGVAHVRLARVPSIDADAKVPDEAMAQLDLPLCMLTRQQLFDIEPFGVLRDRRHRCAQARQFVDAVLFMTYCRRLPSAAAAASPVGRRLWHWAIDAAEVLTDRTNRQRYDTDTSLCSDMPVG